MSNPMSEQKDIVERLKFELNFGITRGWKTSVLMDGSHIPYHQLHAVLECSLAEITRLREELAAAQKRCGELEKQLGDVSNFKRMMDELNETEPVGVDSTKEEAVQFVQELYRILRVGRKIANDGAALAEQKEKE